MGGPPYYPGTTSFASSTTGFYGTEAEAGPRNQDLETGVHRTEAEAGPRNQDLETGVDQDQDPTQQNREMREMADNYRTSPGRHDAGSRQLQGSGPARVNKDGEGFLFF